MMTVLDGHGGVLWCAAAFFGAVVVGVFVFDRGAFLPGARSLDAEGSITQAAESKETDLDEDIELPPGWRVDVVGKKVGGWRQTGTAVGLLDEVAAEVDVLMSSHGYEELRCVEGEEIGDSQKLIQYASKSGTKVMWMLWDMGGGKVGFAWGREK